jgi:predicted nucleic acid-binding protein
VILIDLNVILDVVQAREPHYRASGALLENVVSDQTQACVSAHAITTLHYLLARYQHAAKANEVVDWLIRRFDIAAIGRDELQRARSLGWSNFEDAVVGAAAESVGCTHIITRNVKDFARSAIPALTPEEFLLLIEQ